MGNFKNGIKLLFVAMLVITTACGSSSSTKQPSESGTDGSEYMTLDDHLRRINGVRVTGSGDYAKVMLRARGISNLNRGMETGSKGVPNVKDSNQRQPLFVVDGQKAGRDYPSVRDMFSPGEIKSVRLLSDSEAAQYGGQSGYGVIEITTKTASENEN